MQHDELTDLVDHDRDHECAGYGESKVCVRVVAVADLPTEFGRFRIVAFWNNRDNKDHIAIVHGDVVGRSDVPLRVHSECLTGDALGSLRCDCRAQLQAALRTIATEPHGVVLYMRQEGRGIGLMNKIRAYALQDRGLDTVEANLALGFRDDEREYSVAAHMIHSLGLKSIRLVTNNPDKIRQLTELGIQVSGRIPHLMPPNVHNQAYLRTKAERSGHLIEQADLAIPGDEPEHG
ncbi:MAG: GTP cyclohydrolase II [Myxococcota bacterium]